MVEETDSRTSLAGKTEILDISEFFAFMGVKKNVRATFTDYTLDNDLQPGIIRKGWVYGALLAFKNYAKQRNSVGTFATIGTGCGVDAIGANEFLKPRHIIITDVHPEVLPIAEQNLRRNIPTQVMVTALLGDLCAPLIERGLKADLIYANIPNIPSEDSELVYSGRKSATFFEAGGIKACPDIFQKNLLAHQYLFLRQASDALNNGGEVIIAIGGRVPYTILERLFAENGFVPREMAAIFKLQTEPYDVLPGYANAEKNGIEFDFYRFEPAQKIWQKLDHESLSGTQIKETLKEHRLSATEAWNAYNSGECKTFGIVAHYICGTPKKLV